MLTFFKKYKLAIVIFLLIVIPLFTLSTSFKNQKELKWYDQVILWVTSPVQKGFSWFYHAVISSVDHYFLLVQVKKQNEKWIQENQRLVDVINNMREIELENQRLRNLLAFKEKYLPAGISAEVIARDTTSEYQTVRINKGLDVGFKRRMPVIAPAGVVGQLIQVWQHYSDVLLLTDQNHAVDAMVQRSRARGVIKGAMPPICQLHYLSRADDIQVGDVMITSGIEGIFPKGLRIGTVQKIEQKADLVEQYVEIETSVNLSKLEEVLVITNAVHVTFPSESSE
ncbi:MAG: rod shape-determining protein MreC [Deltaproteobacteria bacterium]|nr:rod shape-determining protein MreC [Deltaproteobacteria bacterium]